MKRFLIACLCAALLASCLCAALAAEYPIMVVVNCEEWVSLRAEPDTASPRLCKVPLGEPVFNCTRQGDFYRCDYGDFTGYILSDYLTPGEDDPESNEPEAEEEVGELVLKAEVNGLQITAERTMMDGGEYLLVACDGPDGEQRWFYETGTEDVTELTLTDAFMGGAAQDPMVMVYNAEQSTLTALDAFTGSVCWTLKEHLGGSITHLVADDGTVYVGGYYGPDPVAIRPDGTVAWRANSGDSVWLYDMAFEEGLIACRYDMLDGDPDRTGVVLFSIDGEMVDKIED